VPAEASNARVNALAGCYLVALLILAVAAFVPSEASVIPFALLFLLALPTSFVAYFVGFVGAAVVFQDPTRNDWLVHVWVVSVWAAAAILQAMLLRGVLLARLRR
jgi:hypothetical protein